MHAVSCLLKYLFFLFTEATLGKNLHYFGDKPNVQQCEKKVVPVLKPSKDTYKKTYTNNNHHRFGFNAPNPGEKKKTGLSTFIKAFVHS